jgi:hypothetical protein
MHQTASSTAAATGVQLLQNQPSSNSSISNVAATINAKRKSAHKSGK